MKQHDMDKEEVIAEFRKHQHRMRRMREREAASGVPDPFKALLSAIDRLDEIVVCLKDPFVGGLLEETTEFLSKERGEIE